MNQALLEAAQAHRCREVTAVINLLRDAWLRDKLKADPIIRGWRTSRDVAEAMGMKLQWARATLELALETGQIECRSDPGNPYAWFAAATPEFRGWLVRRAIKSGEVQG